MRKGFAISIDALLAMVLTIAFIGFIGVGVQEEEKTTIQAATQIRQAADDAFTALDNSGVLAKRLADAALSSTALRCNPGDCSENPGIHDAAKELLPKNIELKVVVNEYRAWDIVTCRAAYKDFTGEQTTHPTIEAVFDECFKSEGGVGDGVPYDAEEYPSTALPTDKDIAHGRKLVIARQPVSPRTGAGECIPEAEVMELEESRGKMEQSIKALLQGELEADIETYVDVVPSDSISCDETTADVTIRARNATREPIAVMLAMDKSGSMATLDMVKCSSPEAGGSCTQTGNCTGGTCKEMGITFGGGTCKGGQPCVDDVDCTGQAPGGWTEIAEFTVDQGLLDAFAASGPIKSNQDRIYIRNYFLGYSGDCAGPRTRVTKGGAVIAESYSNAATYSHIYINESTLAAEGAPSTYKVEAWADEEVTVTSIDEQIYTLYNWLDSGTGFDGGTGEGCEVISGWQTLSTFDPRTPFESYVTAPLQVLGRLKYTNYASPPGVCGEPRVQMKRNGIDPPLGSFSYCDGSRNCYTSWGYDGSWAPGDSFTIEGWSDAPTDYDTYYYYIGRIGYLTITQSTVPASTCSPEPCTMQTNNCSDFEGWQQLGTFEIEADRYDSVRVHFTYSDYSPATGSVCDYPRMRVTPAGGSPTTFSSGDYLDRSGTAGEAEKTFPGSPLSSGTWVIEGWSDDSVTYNIDATVTRMDSAKYSAKTFVSGADWKDNDELGLVSYADSAALMQPLTLATYRQSVIDAIDSLSPSGDPGTALASAIARSATELPGFSYDGKFMIVLTDGQANWCLDGKYCPVAEAIAEAKSEANAARGDGITIYVIGFADQSLMDAEYKAHLEEVARDKDSIYCPGEGTNPQEHCGKYYYAEDEGALVGIYNLIAQDIAREIGSVDIVLKYFLDGTTVTPGDCGLWNETTGWSSPEDCSGAWSGETHTLAFENRGISGLTGEDWWMAEFTMVLPCDAANCYSNYVLLPPAAATIKDRVTEEIIDWDGDEADTIECGTPEYPEEHIKCHKRIPFEYSDLNVAFTYGKIEDSTVKLDFEVDNNGYNPVYITGSKPLRIKFYDTDDPPNQLTPISIGSLELLCDECPSGWALDAEGSDILLHDSVPLEIEAPGNKWKASIVDTVLPYAEEIHALINTDNTVNECPLHNETMILCYTEPSFRFYTIDYYAWVE